MASNKSICNYFYTKLDPSTYKCRYGKVRKQAASTGYENPMSHLRTSHKDYNKCVQVSKEFPPAFIVSNKAQNYFGWLEGTIMGGKNFSFVSNELNRKYSKLTSISRTTLMKLISDLTKAVEQKVAADLPDSFGLVIDGWSFTSASTHYLAAYYQRVRANFLLAFSPLLVEEDLGAKSHVDFITTALGYFNKTVCNVGFLVCDNENLNEKIAKLMGITMIGCYSHRLNLAVEKSSEPYDEIISKLHNLMKKQEFKEICRPSQENRFTSNSS